MSRTPKNNDGLNDADIAALFAADERSAMATAPSAELDAAILENARAAHQQSLVTPEPETFQRKYAPVFATAAVLLIGIGLTPFNTKAPKDAFEADARLALDTAADTDALAEINEETLPEALVALPSVDSGPSQSKVAVAGEDSTRKKSVETDSQDLLQRQTQTRLESEELSVVDANSETEVEQALETETTTAPKRVIVENAIIETDVSIDAESNLQQQFAKREQNTRGASITNDSNNAKKQADNTALASESKTQRYDVEALMESAPVVTLIPSSQIQSDADKDSNVLAKQETNAAPSSRLVEQTPQPVAEAVTEQTELPAQSQIIASDQSNSSQTAAPAQKERRVRPKNYRSSPLLWIIEIRHLHDEKQNELVREELTAFRKKHPDNSNERLLPKELQALETE